MFKVEVNDDSLFWATAQIISVYEDIIMVFNFDEVCLYKIYQILKFIQFSNEVLRLFN